ncbi:HET-domain-containing protein [Hypoxylon trugodes]|uniref:HET-domain-containing protein n=1 Tax=Hypoxylon trugodes TaxID=326681 RepID=UPI002191E507|nr:HET-domain-containing protein [Hypoxylon trugodes]KAI1387558.1 HET-domain-containing protein [Hypoxylon trugodes]
MLRWHRRQCRKPDVSITDDVLFCSSCDSIAELTCLHINHQPTSTNTHMSESSQSLNLRWPLSVQYSTEESRNDSSDGLRACKAGIGSLSLNIQNPSLSDSKKGEPGTDSQLDGRFYTPLAQKYDIRLLKLSTLPSSQYLHGELALVDLVYSPSFEALSYTWAGETGDSTKPKFIFIGSSWDIIPITANCDSALRLLLSKGHMNIWVDSICINQQDPQERTHQVSIMREIFSKASQVLIYLGPAARRSDDAMEALGRLSSLPPAMAHNPEPELSDGQNFGLERLFERRYFSRIWIIQEIAMAKAITFYCGEKGASWSSFSTSGIHIPYRFIQGVPWLSRYGRGTASAMTQPEELLQLLNATSSCSASDPRDNVFAVLGLLRDGLFDGLVPDYLLSTKQVYTGVASYLITRHKKTEILSYPKGRHGSLPTWVPDWSVYRAPKILPSEDESTFQNTPHTDTIFRRKRYYKTEGHGYQEYDDHFKLRLPEDSSIGKDEKVDAIWLKSGCTSWTLFTTNDEQSPRIRYFLRKSEDNDMEHVSKTRPKINATTGALSIHCTVVTSFESFEANAPLEYTRTVSFPSTRDEFEWLVKTENPVYPELDVVAYVPGCDSYLHLRMDQAAGGYALLGYCRIGFRQGTVRNAQFGMDRYKFETISGIPGCRVADVDLVGGITAPNLLCASYGFDRPFLEFLQSLRQSRVGELIVSHLKDQDAPLSGLRGNAMKVYLGQQLGALAVWKTALGWRTSIKGGIGINDVKSLCNAVAEHVKFWAHPATWRALDAIEVAMNSIDSLIQMWSDWNQVARSIAALEMNGLKGKTDNRTIETLADSDEIDTCEHKIEPQVASRLGIQTPQTSLQSLLLAFSKSTTQLMQELGIESELFDYSPTNLDSEEKNGRGSWELIPTERLRLGRIYTKIRRTEAQDPNNHAYDPLLSLGAETFYTKVRSRVDTLEWLQPSWQSYRGHLMGFRHVCQHISGIDAFQDSMCKVQEITIL